MRELATSDQADRFEYTFHLMYHPIIDVDGTSADGKWYTQIYYARSDDIAGWRQGRYLDTYRRVDGDWRFAEVQHTMDSRKEYPFDRVRDETYGDLVEMDPGPAV